MKVSILTIIIRQMNNPLADFDNLTPDLVIESVEAVLDIDLTSYTQPMPSYINRVYELKSEEDKFYIVKFYRPGRWSHDALLEEHKFMLDCDDADIPLAAPIPMTGLVDDEMTGEAAAASAPTLGSIEGFPFAVFNRKGGRLWEAEDEDSWLRIGRLLGRMHNAGAVRPAGHRPVLSASGSFSADLQILAACDWIHPDVKEEMAAVLEKLQVVVGAMFEKYADENDFIRVHGDFHSGNILERPGEGLMLMDFDDMAMSLPVQDLWLLLPDHAPESGKELTAIIEGYREFRSFNTESLMLIEPLRAMRMVYFLCWCGRQKNDFRFQHSFPDWGGKAFWQKEVQDLENQYDQIKRAIEDQKILY